MLPTQQLHHLARNENTYRDPQGVRPRAHSKSLDHMFGYKIPKIEQKLLQKYSPYDQATKKEDRKQHFQGTETWIGLPPQVLQTPYSDILKALTVFRSLEINKIIDIGAGYGRVGLVMNAIFPKSEFIGYEILKKRENEANRIFEKLELENCKVLLQNVLEEGFTLPKADLYFIYDFSEMSDICIILDQLNERVEKESFFLIAKGERVNKLLEINYHNIWIKNGCREVGDLKIYSTQVNLKTF